MAVLGSGFTGGLAFNSADGNLYAIAAAGTSWEIDQITPATGSVTVLGTLAPAGNQAAAQLHGSVVLFRRQCLRSRKRLRMGTRRCIG